MKKPILIAHRGASYESPENTLISFQRANYIGVDFIECDVQISKEGIPVIFHDATLTRICNKRRKISTMSLESIRECDVGEWFHPRFQGEYLPTLEEALSLKVNCGFFIEIKPTSPPKDLAESVIKVILKAPRKKIIIGSFSSEILEEVRKIAPQIPLVGIAETLIGLKKHQDLNLNHYALNTMMINEKRMEQMHDDHCRVWGWTVDDTRQAKRLIEMGVEGIVSNHPRRMRPIFYKNPFNTEQRSSKDGI
ncbi:MAG: hypothetical protein JHC93_02785 [Parachlamydiales bacterium]|nr:hypothetical protein [Parachlamydiales bacterium]